MKYMLFTYRDPSVQLDPEQRAAVPAAVSYDATTRTASTIKAPSVMYKPR